MILNSKLYEDKISDFNDKRSCKSVKYESGFSLIEVVVYTTLLSFIILGIFSSLFSYLNFSLYKPTISEDDYELLIKNFHE